MKRLFWLAVLAIFSFGCRIGSMNVEFTTPTATPNVVSEQDYLTSVVRIVDSISANLRQISILAGTPRSLNRSWQDAIKAEGKSLRLGYEELRHIIPPTKYVEFHRQLVTAVSDCAEATVHMENGVDRMDASELELSASLFTSCGDKLPKLPKD